MFCMAFVSSLPAQDNFCHPRTISVTGTAEIKAAPDEVALTLAVDSRDKDLSVAKADNDQRIKKLLSFAHAAGVESKEHSNKRADDGSWNIPKKGYRNSWTIRCRRSLSITLTDLSKYEDLMTNSLKAGVNRVDGY